MEKYALFLPQFHEIEENNIWWGKGFTEWTNIRKAKKYFNWQKVNEPKDDNYYNLLDIDTVRWQTDLMSEYGIDGLVYYHYWFNGKLLMEKPVENLLNHKEIHQKFFFCWANHTFSRGGNRSREILLEQTYGDENEWEKHFLYLIKYFIDERYVKKCEKPVLMIFKSGFPNENKMLEYFNKRCIDYGFQGIYIIFSYHGENYPNDLFVLKQKNVHKFTYSYYLREPSLEQSMFWNLYKNKPIWWKYKIQKLLNRWGLYNKPLVYDGNRLMELKMSNEPHGSNIIPGISFEWDNTSRHGNKGYIITPIDKKHFFDYMDSVSNTQMLIINAWNEWCEGMVLEPSKANGYKYLEWIKEWSEKNDQ